VGRRHHLRAHLGGLPLRRRRRRRLFPNGRRLEHGGHLRTELILDALDMAIERRRPGEGLVHHSDQGTQYTSLAFGRRAREAGIALSMGSVGDAYDNAMAESFFASLETELLDRTTSRTRADARLAVFDYIEAFYNRIRRHSALELPEPSRLREEVPFRDDHCCLTVNRPRKRGNFNIAPRWPLYACPRGCPSLD
jgi:transposase InsO family protein